MPWWEAQLERELRGLDSEELRRLLERLLLKLSEAQYRAVLGAVRDEGARRGIVAPRAGAGQEAAR